MHSEPGVIVVNDLALHVLAIELYLSTPYILKGVLIWPLELLIFSFNGITS